MYGTRIAMLILATVAMVAANSPTRKPCSFDHCATVRCANLEEKDCAGFFIAARTRCNCCNQCQLNDPNAPECTSTKPCQPPSTCLEGVCTYIRPACPDIPGLICN